jgi:hypothetical protein
MAAEKKSTTLFDLIDGITHKKRDWNSWSEPDQKKFSSYMVNRYLSMRMELTEFVNELQRYTIGILRPKETYQLYHDLLPNTKSYSKYIKSKTDDKYTPGLVDQIAEHYQVSKSEAIEYINLLSSNRCDYILSLYGYTESDKKKLLKGVK